ncbi:hypothetical protein SAMN05421839_10226 [Halolactibacillus halophilus]|uniref:Uncharacterized protein n=1 Tax=Halolactibacillus halophilus TaxID=306540 RepID=A0A1I5LDT8_9BACI|nr:hypothetical protein [Halolactibacillus halophilus]GEM00866.1 hypothetical protein HHA03_03980 [Halolactibacillus halophilus]SFO95534.1 hypothetical protein SAMN05421839_10226 [Halolactibacillus halophilus]
MHYNILALLKEKHGEKLDLKNDVYYLFLEDAVVCVYFDEDEKSIKVEIEILPETTFVYYSTKNLDSLI